VLKLLKIDENIESIEHLGDYELINPRTGKPVRKLKAKYVWDLIIESAWKSGDPGVIFIDEINRYNPTPEIGKIEATNPCGEFLGLPYESCNLGSINLSKMIKENEVDWEKLKKTVHTAVHFLDNVIDANRFPLERIEKMTKANRKIGLGVMGFAELLIRLKISYDSEKAIDLAERIMKFITEEARKTSEELGERRGSFPNFEKSIFYGRYKAMRNATTTTIAPTGTISIIAGCSSGIEPLFAISFMRNVLEGTRLFEVNPLFERIAKDRKFYSTSLLEKIAREGSIQNIKEIPDDVKKIFKTALDIKPEWHARMQAAFQKYVDNAVSKTINLPENATKIDVKNAFELTYKLKCKGITVYRYGSKPQQVLYIGEKHITAEPEYSGGCPKTVCPL
jgi:ribonucleoside-diphosphate reductase alpha chain